MYLHDSRFRGTLKEIVVEVGIERIGGISRETGSRNRKSVFVSLTKD